ncbi:limbin-like [Amphiura filiformis]|uniref:limbin-like n=1 Tax=Amphiura filiformis TaxID=82378 RepID=UPI003B216623
MSYKISQTRTKYFTMFLVLFLCVLWQVPCSDSQVLNATLDVPSAAVNGDTVYLSDNLNIVVSILFDTETLESLYILVTLPYEIFVKDVNANNSIVTAGSNIIISDTNITQLTESSCSLFIQNVSFINTSLDNALANQISFTFNGYVHESKLSKGDILVITGDVNYTLSMQANHTSISMDPKSLQYGGPEVQELLLAEGFPIDENATQQSITVEREIQLSTRLPMPGMWSINDVVVHLDLVSTSLTNIPVQYLQCVVTPASTNVTFSNITNIDVTYFIQDGNTITPIHHISKRDVAAEANLVWTIGDIINTGTEEVDLEIMIRFLLSDASDLVDGSMVDLSLYMDMNDVVIDLANYQLVVREPQLSVTKTVSKTSYVEEGKDHSIQKVRFTTTVTHSPDSMADAYDVVIEDDVGDLYVEYFSPVMRPAFGTTGLTPGSSLISLKQDMLAVGDTMELSYVAFLNDEAVEHKQTTPFTFEAEVGWISSDPNLLIPGHPGRTYGPITADACLNQITSYEEDLILNHGLAALFFFVFMLVGFLLVIIIFLIWIKCCRNSEAPYAVVNPTRATRAAQAGGLIINPGSNKKSALESIKGSSMVSIDDSVILVLALKDKGKKYQEFNNLDVWATIQTDISLEKQRLSTMQDCIVILIHQWVMEGQISKDLEAKTVKKFQRNVKDMLKRLEDEYREECREAVKKLSVQNLVKLQQLRNKQKNQVSDAENNTKNMEKEEKKEIRALLEKQHQAESDELTKLLKLQQEEELEKIRKEYAIKKRMDLKGQQSATLDEVILQGELDEEQATSLIREHKSNVATLEKLMDDEVSRQRMLLEEKLARRKAMAHANEIQTDEQRNLLNVLASQTLSPVQELQKDHKLTDDEAFEYVERVKKEMLVAKEKADAERKKQEETLHKKLSEKKKKMMDQKSKEHQQQQEKLEKGFKINHERDDIGCDDFLAANFTLMSQQRDELFEIETELDDEAAKELETLRDGVVDKTKEQIDQSKGGIYKELMDKGLTEDMKDEILEQHQRDVERLMEERAEQREKQERTLKKKLAKHRQEWARKKQEEKVEQEQIREHENKMVDKLLASQMAMSEDERKRIMEEHEKQMVALENSLSLGKLRQRRLIEEKQAARKARQLQKMEQEHSEEALRQMRRAQLDSDEEDSAQEKQQELIKKQVQERIDVLYNEDNEQLEEHQEQVRDEMVKERAQSLQKQEEKIGALMATLQLQKAREIATIEEQQKALWKLKLEMLDDMTEKGVIKNSECKKLVEAHAKEAKALEDKIQSQKVKQEKELRKRLQGKMAEREKSFLARQEKELEDLCNRETNGVAERLKRVALKHKHMVQIEEFRHKIEIELSQTLEELRRYFEVARLKQKQEQELQFLAALVKYGKFDPSELRKVLQLLFPSKTDDEIQDMMARLYDKDEWDSEEERNENGSQRRTKKTTDKNTSSLEDRMKATLMGETLQTNQSEESTLKKSKKVDKKGKLAPLKAEKKKADPFATTFSGPALPSINHRPEPLGRTATPDDDSEIDRRARYDTSSDEYDDDDDADTKRRIRPAKKKMDYTY